VANVSGVAELAEMLHANWAMVSTAKNRINLIFFVDMIISGVWVSKD
jgi:hypothetical protein